MAEGTCQYCGRPTATDICPAHGYVGKAKEKVDKIPIGLIALWSGAVATIPANWALCDGTNGTPNLTDRFIICAGSNAPGVTGGSNATHSHTTSVSGGGGGTSGAGSSHSHSGGAVTDASAVATRGNGDHYHGNYTGATGESQSSTAQRTTGGTTADTPGMTHTHTNNHTHANSGDHSHIVEIHGHGFTQAGAESSHTHTVTAYGGGSFTSGGNSTFPVAYYALAYIMKTGG
jgi:hypothetical protein